MVLSCNVQEAILEYEQEIIDQSNERNIMDICNKHKVKPEIMFLHLFTCGICSKTLDAAAKSHLIKELQEKHKTKSCKDIYGD